MRVHLLLADFAEVINGKLYLMGGGWDVVGPAPTPMALAGIIEVPWEETNRPHQLALRLVTEDEQPVQVSTPTGERPLEVTMTFEVGRPPGKRPGTSSNIPFALNLGPLPLLPGRRHLWRASIDGQGHEAWRLPFETRPAPAGATVPPASPGHGGAP